MIEVERTDFMSVPVQDMERARRFYSETLGMRSPNLDDAWPEFETGNVSLYLVDPTAIGAEFAPHTSHIALRVPDVVEARSRLEEAGVAFEGDIRDTGVCHMAFFRDSEGNALMLHRRYAP
ncbi:MAG TPA: VOC family protein [Gaiellaceae bacterium]|nr:VOC family protein [Gaiellaceae bacterium]HET8652332.1 VOC family protein [Gaiellaceae bacterium]